jgi:hypothetical protein
VGEQDQTLGVILYHKDVRRFHLVAPPTPLTRS